MLHGQRDRLLQKHLDPPYGERPAIRKRPERLLWPTAERAASWVAARSHWALGDRAHARARAMLNTVLRRTSWVSVRTTNSRRLRARRTESTMGDGDPQPRHGRGARTSHAEPALPTGPPVTSRHLGRWRPPEPVRGDEFTQIASVSSGRDLPRGRRQRTNGGLDGGWRDRGGARWTWRA